MQNFKFSINTARSMKKYMLPFDVGYIFWPGGKYVVQFLERVWIRVEGTKRTQDHDVSSLAGARCLALRGCCCLSLSLLSSQWLSAELGAGAGPWWHIPLRPRHNSRERRQGRGAKIVLNLTVSWQSPTKLVGDNSQPQHMIKFCAWQY